VPSLLSAGGRQKVLAIFWAAVIVLGVGVGIRVFNLTRQVGGRSTYGRVRLILIRRLGVDPTRTRPADRLGPPQGEGSLNRQELAAVLAEEMGISVTDEEANSLTTVDDVVRVVESRLGSSQ